MTASHMVYDGLMYDIGVNYEIANRDNIKVEYNINDPGFKVMISSIALGSKAYFNYEPSEDDIKTYIAKK